MNTHEEVDWSALAAFVDDKDAWQIDIRQRMHLPAKSPENSPPRAIQLDIPFDMEIE